MTDWHLARSLDVLRNQINTMAPHRSKASDGTKGDKAHEGRPSRHNPNNAHVVCALDITDDPAKGCPIHHIAEQIRTHPHPNLEYIISNRRVAGRSTGWTWHAYDGPNHHVKHAHFGVGDGPDSEPRPPYDDTSPWHTSGNNHSPAGAVPRTLRQGMKGEDVRGLQAVLIGAGHLAGGRDGVFGPKTAAAVKKLQAQLGVTPDGVVGPKTHAAIARTLAFLAATARPR